MTTPPTPDAAVFLSFASAPLVSEFLAGPAPSMVCPIVAPLSFAGTLRTPVVSTTKRDLSAGFTTVFLRNVMGLPTHVLGGQVTSGTFNVSSSIASGTGCTWSGPSY